MTDELLNRGLPKWPKMLVTGVPVTVEQAKEIIRRTDMFFAYTGFAGNDPKHRERLVKLFKIPGYIGYDKFDASKGDWVQAERDKERWFEKWGFIHTEYVHNDWIASAFVSGPYGWCHPSGSIGFVDNVGKWPSVENIVEDWKALAEEFPFLNIGVTLYSGEQCEDDTHPVVSLRILEGTVTLVDPALEDVHAGHPEATRNDTGLSEEETWALKMETLRSGSLSTANLECAIEESWFQEWSNVV